MDMLGRPEARWTVARMAQRAYLSRARFTALYKEFFGLSPMEDVISMRMQKARWLLENSTLSVKEIGRQVGFEDHTYFNRIFRKKVGESPGRYRG
jgi:AraC-like DNA-binding protein